MAESGYPNFNASFSYVLAAPAGTPPDIVQLLAREVALAMNSPEVREHDRVADYAPTHMNQTQSAAWPADMRVLQKPIYMLLIGTDEVFTPI